MVGIYKIENISNGKIYIGQSSDIRSRRNGHLSRLRNDRHENKHLQYSYNKYGADSFIFSIVLVTSFKGCDVDIDRLERLEELYIDMYKAKTYGYNIRKYARSNLGLRATEETRERMSKAQKGHRKSIGEENGSSKLKTQDVIKIKMLLKLKKYKHQEIANMFDIDRSVITSINTGRSWSHIN